MVAREGHNFSLRAAAPALDRRQAFPTSDKTGQSAADHLFAWNHHNQYGR